MYDISYFKASDPEQVMAFMKAHPFIILCGATSDGKPVATHIPILIEEREGKIFLLAHVMKKQDHSLAFEQNQQVLAIFSGAHTYVSASWYQNKASASTWNYQAVHAHGTLHFLNDEQLVDALAKLTAHFENNPHSPALVSKMEKSYIDKMVNAIVGFEIEVEKLEHVFKLSQNRDEKSYENIVTELNKQGGEAKDIAERMIENAEFVFEKKGQ